MASSNQKAVYPLPEGFYRAHIVADGPVPEGETWRDPGGGSVVVSPQAWACHFCADPGTTCEQRYESDEEPRVIVHAPA